MIMLSQQDNANAPDIGVPIKKTKTQIRREKRQRRKEKYDRMYYTLQKAERAMSGVVNGDDYSKLEPCLLEIKMLLKNRKVRPSGGHKK